MKTMFWSRTTLVLLFALASVMSPLLALRVFLSTSQSAAQPMAPNTKPQDAAVAQAAPSGAPDATIAPPSDAPVDGGGRAAKSLTAGLHELSPWTMFWNADVLVKAVMVGLALASLATWTNLIAKSIEFSMLRAKVRGGLRGGAGAGARAGARRARGAAGGGRAARRRA